MRVEEIALRSEIRQMLNEAGFNRDTIKQMVKECIDDIVEHQVNQVLMERKEQNLETVVENYINKTLRRQILDCTETAIQKKLQRMNFQVNVYVDNKPADKKGEE